VLAINSCTNLCLALDLCCDSSGCIQRHQHRVNYWTWSRGNRAYAKLDIYKSDGHVGDDTRIHRYRDSGNLLEVHSNTLTSTMQNLSKFFTVYYKWHSFGKPFTCKQRRWARLERGVEFVEHSQVLAAQSRMNASLHGVVS
jgi:hypothetical protein